MDAGNAEYHDWYFSGTVECDDADTGCTKFTLVLVNVFTSQYHKD